VDPYDELLRSSLQQSTLVDAIEGFEGGGLTER